MKGRAWLDWLAAEPFRVFFLSGAIWSIAGVSLWPLFYAHALDFYPNQAHARLMIECFGGAFVAGFLGTAGPRMASAPRLTAAELVLLFALHQACAICQLTQRPWWGDTLFIAFLVSLAAALITRLLKFRRDAPPPQMVLALGGILSGISGAAMMIVPAWGTDPRVARLAQLLLYQGMLLLPVLGIGSFLFPRILGGGFGEPRTSAERRAKLWRSVAAAALLPVSFFLEAFGDTMAGYMLRAAVAAAYLILEVRWRRHDGDVPRGSLTNGLKWALGLGLCGLLLPPRFYLQHISIEHLLYIGGFGMLMLIISSRVLFGHSGDLDGFFVRSGWIRFLIFLGVLTALTRATPAWVPSTTVSHHIYASGTWATLAVCWLLWHRRRFARRSDD